ncbi:hypothetical protein F2Q65_08345 [Thiohalocapsa marina]|uniref:PIN domain-containing protein n=1 Tax=Thiohalocapsa marina TaxID=424902 RepID=A0A5M8FKP3_9GAMM|nr:hypothetical protein [Thiohalocapsa marina]KAA6185483.1 hypothetical protein F2Q65_08345 [Thiohalocapsa marina]
MDLRDILLDSTVIIGAELADPPDSDDCHTVLALAQRGELRGHIGGSALQRAIEELALNCGEALAQQRLAALRGYLRVVPTTDGMLDEALQTLCARSNGNAAAGDFLRLDDAITIQTAVEHQLPVIVSLNAPDLITSNVRGLTPRELLGA